MLIREASAAPNLEALIPLACESGPSRIAFCTDDREPEHIADDGHINAMIRDAVALGIPPEDALVMASLSPALYHGLDHLGAIATFPLSKVLDASRGSTGQRKHWARRSPRRFRCWRSSLSR